MNNSRTGAGGSAIMFAPTVITADTSGLSAATVLAAVDSGVDAIDAAIDALSGNTSQPCLGSLAEELIADEAERQARSHGLPAVSLGPI